MSYASFRSLHPAHIGRHSLLPIAAALALTGAVGCQSGSGPDAVLATLHDCEDVYVEGAPCEFRTEEACAREDTGQFCYCEPVAPEQGVVRCEGAEVDPADDPEVCSVERLSQCLDHGEAQCTSPNGGHCECQATGDGGLSLSCVPPEECDGSDPGVPPPPGMEDPDHCYIEYEVCVSDGAPLGGEAICDEGALHEILQCAQEHCAFAGSEEELTNCVFMACQEYEGTSPECIHCLFAELDGSIPIDERIAQCSYGEPREAGSGDCDAQLLACLGTDAAAGEEGAPGVPPDSLACSEATTQLCVEQGAAECQSDDGSWCRCEAFGDGVLWSCEG